MGMEIKQKSLNMGLPLKCWVGRPCHRKIRVNPPPPCQSHEMSDLIYPTFYFSLIDHIVISPNDEAILMENVDEFLTISSEKIRKWRDESRYVLEEVNSRKI